MILFAGGFVVGFVAVLAIGKIAEIIAFWRFWGG